MKTKNLILSLAMALIATVGFAQGFTSQKMSAANTAHNFANGDGGTAGVGYAFASGNGGTCAVCHTPHTGGTQLPLWNRDGAVAGDFAVYTSGTMDGTTDLAGGGSLLCLSCHDGSANLDSYGGTAYANPGSGTAIQAADAYANVGFDLTNDHPVGVTYPTDGAQATGQQMEDRTNHVGVVLYTNKVECASCHSMHNPAVISKLLVTVNTNSELCLECHAK